jgi:hypothetical protein
MLKLVHVELRTTEHLRFIMSKLKIFCGYQEDEGAFLIKITAHDMTRCAYIICTNENAIIYLKLCCNIVLFIKDFRQ